MAQRLAFVWLSGRLLLALCVPASTTWANDCQEMSAAAVASETMAAPGQQLLGQGVALFDPKHLKMTAQVLQSALFAERPKPNKRVLAHKYLTFEFCSNGESARCGAEFDAAFLVRPSFSLDVYEIQNTPWRDVYRKSQTRWAARCEKQLAPIQSGLNAGMFALNSVVIMGISPLMPAEPESGLPLAKSAVPTLVPQSNVRLRVSPLG